jgi:Holliday junction DNA helicase RuvB
MAIISSKTASRTRTTQERRRGVHKSSQDPPVQDLLQPQAALDEQGKQEESIRPQRFADYIGQKDPKDVLDIAIKAAKVRGETLDHLLLYGPPGLGKLPCP